MAGLTLIRLLLIILTTEIAAASNLKQGQSEYRDHRDVPLSLIMGTGGPPPHFFLMDGKIRGSDMLIIELLAKKLHFAINITNKGLIANELVEMVIQLLSF